METEIFYPNKLTYEEALSLSGWKLKVATLHFGKTRNDCVSLGYGYIYRPEKWTDSRPDWEVSDIDTILLAADKSEEYKQPISLRGEIEWDDWASVFAETGCNIPDYCREYVAEYFKVIE